MTRRRLAPWPVVALALLLGACAGGDLGHLPATPGVAAAPIRPPLLATHWFRADDGAVLPLHIWLPKGKVEATILALHGFDDYSNAFAGAAAEWAKHGIATYAYDQRGFGQAPDRGYWVGTYRLDQDAAIASRLVAARHPGVPHFLLGESMGGAVAITAVTGAVGALRPVADGIILVAPAVWGRATMNVFERVALWAGDTVVPGLTLTGSGLHIMASDNIPMLRALGRDPLVIKATRVDTIYGLVNIMDRALAAAPRLDLPMLLLYGQHDEIIPRDAVETMIAELPRQGAAMRRIAWYPDGYHMLLRDLDGKIVQRDIERWIADPAAPLPSGADRDAAPLVTA
ncbi:MAG TPA: lysophospholipase, partial [Stellaceae bacterium]|nr:lysophospholipase [Stellaceae bacterium]